MQREIFSLGFLGAGTSGALLRTVPISQAREKRHRCYWAGTGRVRPVCGQPCLGSSVCQASAEPRVGSCLWDLRKCWLLFKSQNQRSPQGILLQPTTWWALRLPWGPPSTSPPEDALHAGATLHSFCEKSIYCLHCSESYHLEAAASEGVAMEMNFLS